MVPSPRFGRVTVIALLAMLNSIVPVASPLYVPLHDPTKSPAVGVVPADGGEIPVPVGVLNVFCTPLQMSENVTTNLTEV